MLRYSNSRLLGWQAWLVVANEDESHKQRGNTLAAGQAKVGVLEWGAYLHPVHGWLGWGIGRRQAGVSCTSFHCGWSGQGGGLERAGAMSVGGGSSSLSSCLGLASLGSRWGCWFSTWVGGSGGSGGGSTRMGVKAAGWFDPVPCRSRGARWGVFEMGVF